MARSGRSHRASSEGLNEFKCRSAADWPARRFPSSKPEVCAGRSQVSSDLQQGMMRNENVTREQQEEYRVRVRGGRVASRLKDELVSGGGGRQT